MAEPPDIVQRVSGIGNSSVVLAVMGLLIGIGSSIVYFGGSLRQIDINTATIAEWRSQGTPLSQLIRAEVEDLRLQIRETQVEIRGMHDADSHLEAQIASMREVVNHITTIETRRVDQISESLSIAEKRRVDQISDLQQRLSAAEALLKREREAK